MQRVRSRKGGEALLPLAVAFACENTALLSPLCGLNRKDYITRSACRALPLTFSGGNEPQARLRLSIHTAKHRRGQGRLRRLCNPCRRSVSLWYLRVGGRKAFSRAWHRIAKKGAACAAPFCYSMCPTGDAHTPPRYICGGAARQPPDEGREARRMRYLLSSANRRNNVRRNTPPQKGRFSAAHPLPKQQRRCCGRRRRKFPRAKKARRKKTHWERGTPPTAAHAARKGEHKEGEGGSDRRKARRAAAPRRGQVCVS